MKNKPFYKIYIALLQVFSLIKGTPSANPKLLLLSPPSVR